VLAQAFPLYIIVLLVCIPQLSETIYVPSLIHLAQSFHVSINEAEFTLTTYLGGFGLGVLMWGSVSDKIGRKPAFIMGLVIFILACLGCYMTENFMLFQFFRILQAFGASVGSVVGQAAARDVVKPEERGRIFSIIGMVIAFAPAIGPVIGSTTLYYWPWNTVFLILIFIALVAIGFVSLRLPETRDSSKVIQSPIMDLYKQCFIQMICDYQVLGLGFLVGSINGILFGYFAEAPFYFMKALGLSPGDFGILSFLICLPLLAGGVLSHLLNRRKLNSFRIIDCGLILNALSAGLFMGLYHMGLITTESTLMAIILSAICICGVVMGNSLIIPNVLGHALNNYGGFPGTAASLFGFYYYVVASSFTGLMSYLHNGTISQLPLFLGIMAASMVIIRIITLRQNETSN